jgi:hypothetical protein
VCRGEETRRKRKKRKRKKGRGAGGGGDSREREKEGEREEENHRLSLFALTFFAFPSHRSNVAHPTSLRPASSAAPNTPLSEHSRHGNRWVFLSAVKEKEREMEPGSSAEKTTTA